MREKTREELIADKEWLTGQAFSPTVPAAEGKKNDTGKVRMELFPMEALEAISTVLTFGAKEYGDNNWRQGLSYGRILGASLRHLAAFVVGDRVDKESGLPHLWHLGCNVAFLIAYEADKDKYKLFDDLWRKQ